MMNIIKKLLNVIIEVCTTTIAVVILLNLLILTSIGTGLILILFSPVGLVIIILMQLEKIEKWLTT